MRVCHWRLSATLVGLGRASARVGPAGVCAPAHTTRAPHPDTTHPAMPPKPAPDPVDAATHRLERRNEGCHHSVPPGLTCKPHNRKERHKAEMAQEAAQRAQRETHVAHAPPGGPGTGRAGWGESGQWGEDVERAGGGSGRGASPEPEAK